MTHLSEFLKIARDKYASLEVRYIHPSLYVICTDSKFEEVDEEERVQVFLGPLGLSSADVELVIASSGVVLQLATPLERESELAFIDAAPSGHHWIEFLADAARYPLLRRVVSPRIVHLYGYKGGQARSTVLCMLAKSLAEDGYRVLAVDADVEAPSLQRQFGSRIVKLDGTLLGCVQYGLSPYPQPVHIAKPPAQGHVDLIGCRPSDPSYDLEHAVFALNSALSPGILQAAFERIIAIGAKYDIVLVDHRSGLGSTILPLAATFPGSTVIFARLDELSDEADNYFGILLEQNPDLPGLFVSFTLDPEDTHDKLVGKNRTRIDALLEILAKAISVGASSDSVEHEEPAVSGEELLGYWVSWFHDRAFLNGGSPSVEALSSDNRNALARIRERLGLNPLKRPVVAAIAHVETATGGGRQLTNSGNTDQGLLIQTEALRKLTAPNSPYSYVLGRKGTGKTRLVRTLAERGVAMPLLVAEQFPDTTALTAADTIIKDLAAALGPTDAEKLWWILLEAVSRNSAAERRDSLSGWLKLISQQSSAAVSISEIANSIRQDGAAGAYLIDGVETAFHSGQMSAFVEGLFRFLSAVQADSVLAQKLTIRLFIRTDLVRRAVENVEQQIEGRSLILSWDTQSILNFALSRICELQWFRQQFNETVARLESELGRLAEGAMPESECNEFLLSIFPNKIRRNNLLTLTFLKDYFSEGVGETASFYPRIYDTFLRSLADPSMISGRASRMDQIEDGRVAQPLIIAAHDYASREYLNQVAAELKYLVLLAEDPKENETRVESLIASFSGMPTPFRFETCLSKVHQTMNLHHEIERDRVRDALQLMKQVGIFEDRPGFPGWWRVGRLFKAALGMKYVR